jgi:PAS domain S-box-containing protein
MAEAELGDLRQSEDRLHAVIESSPLAIVEFDLESHVVGWNRAAERIFGWTREEMLGRDDIPHVPDSKRAESRHLDAIVTEGRAFSDYETVRQRKNGTPIDVAIAGAPVRDGSGQVVGNMVIYSDISERKLQEASLAESQELGHIGSWDWDMASDRVHWSDELFRILGREPGSEEVSYELYLSAVHPDDLDLVVETIEAADDDYSPFAFEHRVLLPDGQVRWILSRGRAITDESGKPIRMHGTAQDITERKVQEAELQRLNAELHARLEDLAASRARIVAAGDIERRRLERNLHDGAQQRLVTLSVSLKLALDRLDKDPAAVRDLLAAASEELTCAVEELQELARGLHPAVLTERGLGAAIESLVRRVPVPVEIVETPSERLGEPIEAAAYYLIAEALTNVAKHAQAKTARIRVVKNDDAIVVEIADDGVGGADAATGSGLRGLADRVEALGGTLELTSNAGDGTRLRAELPV